MEEKRFNPAKLDKLNDPARLKDFPVDFVIPHLSVSNPKTMVDIGAGTGFFSKQFAQQFPGSVIYALDISEIMVNWMNKHIVNDYKNINPLQMDDNMTHLQDQLADLVFMVNLHHELYNPELMLKESYRILKPNGNIAISDWRKEAAEQGPPREIRCEPEQVKDQLKVAGFRNIQTFTNFPNNFLIIGQK